MTDKTTVPAWAVMSLMGSKARNLLQSQVRDDISNSTFPFATLRELTISGATLRVLRITLSGFPE
jgi:4-methylaminobutanoate oxidase (formaldehyde-forming)